MLSKNIKKIILLLKRSKFKTSVIKSPQPPSPLIKILLHFNKRSIFFPKSWKIPCFLNQNRWNSQVGWVRFFCEAKKRNPTERTLFKAGKIIHLIKHNTI